MSVTNLQRFFHLLSAAGAVSIDDGALLTSWEVSSPVGDPDNQVARFNWTDGECDDLDTLTEGGVAAGSWDEDGKFVLPNAEGEPTTVRFFALEQLSGRKTKAETALSATQQALADAMARAEDAENLLNQLSTRVRQAYDQRSSPLGISPGQWAAIRGALDDVARFKAS